MAVRITLKGANYEYSVECPPEDEAWARRAAELTIELYNRDNPDDPREMVITEIDPE